MLPAHWQPRSASSIDTSDPLGWLLSSRGRSTAELQIGLSDLLPVRSLEGVTEVAGRLLDLAHSGNRIAVVGDFDCDGATASVVLLKALRAIGADVFSIIPSRIAHGYGLSPAVSEAAQRAGATVLVTVDNGVSAHAGIARARALGVEVLITDHHLPGDMAPDAPMINPNGRGSSFPSRALAGVGVAFYLALEIGRQAAERGRGFADHRQLLGLVAVGTIADLVPVDRNNLLLINAGLRQIRAGRAGPGIEALCRASNIDAAALTSTDIAFSIAPRINAAGRLAEMSLGISCLDADDHVQAQHAALALTSKNAERRLIQADGEALVLDEAAAQSDRAAIVVWSNQLHEGVVGIIAGRLREKFHRPCIVFAVRDDGIAKGSARSVPGVHLRDALAHLDASHPGMLRAFGGHAAAAGLTVEAADLPAVREASIKAIEAAMQRDPAGDAGLLHDGLLPAQLLELSFALQLESVPWGQGIPAPLFLGDFSVLRAREMRGGHLRLQLNPANSDRIVDAVWFNPPEPAAVGSQIQALYSMAVNRFAG